MVACPDLAALAISAGISVVVSECRVRIEAGFDKLVGQAATKKVIEKSLLC